VPKKKGGRPRIRYKTPEKKENDNVEEQPPSIPEAKSPTVSESHSGETIATPRRKEVAKLEIFQHEKQRKEPSPEYIEQKLRPGRSVPGQYKISAPKSKFEFVERARVPMAKIPNYFEMEVRIES